MKKYNIDELRVVKVIMNNKIYYLLCKYNALTNSYREIFTNKKITIHNEDNVELLSYYSILEQRNYSTGKPLTLNKKELLQKCIQINHEKSLQQTMNQKELSLQEKTKIRRLEDGVFYI